MVTRLGYKLFELGFTWFKDWYFSEGFMEGGVKLQGEKPLNTQAKRRQSKRIFEEVTDFLRERNKNDVRDNQILFKAVKRGEAILSSLRNEN